MLPIVDGRYLSLRCPISVCRQEIVSVAVSLLNCCFIREYLGRRQGEMRSVNLSRLGPLQEEVDCIPGSLQLFGDLLLLHPEMREYRIAESLELLDMLVKVI